MLLFPSIVFLDLYLYENIIDINFNSTHKNSLIFAIFYALVLIWFYGRKYNLNINIYSLCFFLILNVYILLKIVFETDGIDFLYNFYLSTTSGFMMFYCLGVIYRSCYALFTLQAKLKKSKFLFLFILYFIFFSITTYNVFKEYSGALRTDILLLEGIEARYQRIGSFLNLRFFIFCFLSIIISKYIFVRKNVKTFAFNLTLTILAFFLYIFTILIAQFVGSNNCVVTATFTFLFFVLFLNSNIFGRLFDFFNESFFFSNFKLCLVIVIISVPTFSFLSLTIQSLGIDPTYFRILGYGRDGVIDSFSARIDLLANFNQHFAYSPILGHLRVHSMLTGEGTYCHSFILSVLTHLGLLGGFIISLFVLSSVRANTLHVGTSYNCHNVSINYTIEFSKRFLLILFIISSFFTFYTFTILWFVFGFSYPFFAFNKS
jgi:hypothetical protein